MIKRINFIAGPGAGKDTVATYIFSNLKMKGYNCEMISEYVKKWTYFNRNPKKFEQVYILGKQLFSESEVLNAGFDFLISPSPLFLNSYYWYKSGCPCLKENINIVKEFENQYNSLNIFLNRGDIPFSSVGRFQNKEESIKYDKEIKQFIENNFDIKLYEFETVDKDGILNFIIEKICNL